ncbi:MAG: flagellar motor protein MotD [Candidatus Manganitrophaceae bacterium]|nr:MAG: flagellar motor protein MotD [Candidatus Manganitrophaceae bacterium]
MKKKKHEEHENMERWLVSYADFITLLFAFFVVMYSTSSVHEGKYRAVADSINSAFHPIVAFSSSNIRLTPKSSGSEMFNIGLNLYRKFEEGVKKLDHSGRIKVIREGRGMVIRISESLAFETGQAEILPEFAKALDQIAEWIVDAPNDIQIEGHTDNIPINTPHYSSNWELSASRASQIVRYFIEHHAMSPDRFSVAGYAEFRPIATNETLEGRSKNRRIEIVLLNEQKEQSEQPVFIPPVADPTP